MSSRIEFGYIELLLVCGAWLYTQGLIVIGSTFCVLSIVGSITRFGLSVQRDQEREMNQRLLVENFQRSGEEFAESIEPFNKAKKTKR